MRNRIADQLACIVATAVAAVFASAAMSGIAVPVPEPGTTALLALGLGAMVLSTQLRNRK